MIRERFIIDGVPVAIKQYLRLTSLLPGEAWVSMRRRSMRANHYESLSIHDSPARHLLKRLKLWDNLDHPTKAETYRILSGLSQIEMIDIYRSTLHVFAVVSTQPPYPREPIVLKDGKSYPLLTRLEGTYKANVYSYVKYCPDCLGEQPYFRLIWIPAATSMCLKHSCLLVDNCQFCATTVSVDDVVSGRCHYCRVELSGKPSLRVYDEICFNSQQLIQSIFMNRVPANGKHKLPTSEAYVLYHLLEGIKTLVQHVAFRGTYIHSPTEISPHFHSGITETLLLYATAYKVVINWPESFTEFQAEYPKNYGRSLARDIQYDFDRVYRWIELI